MIVDLGHRHGTISSAAETKRTIECSLGFTWLAVTTTNGIEGLVFGFVVVATIKREDLDSVIPIIADQQATSEGLKTQARWKFELAKLAAPTPKGLEVLQMGSSGD